MGTRYLSCIEQLEHRQLLHAIFVDPTFGADGALAIETQALAEQPDGKIIVALHEAGSGDASNLALMRLTGEGTADKTFAGKGLIHTDVLGGADTFEQMAVDTRGMIYVLATSRKPGSQTPRHIVIRYQADGEVDKAFADSGQLEVSTIFDHFIPETLTTDYWDRLIIAGQLVDAQGELVANVAVARFIHDGVRDPHWGDQGIAATMLGDTATPVKVLKMIESSVTLAAQDPAHTNDITLLRYTPRGRLDKTYGANGASIHSFSPDPNGGAGPALTDVVLAYDNAVLYCGSYGLGNQFILRTGPNGTLDTTFGTNGILQPGDFAYINLRTDGMILTATAGPESKALHLFDDSGKLVGDFGDRGMLIGYAGRLTSSHSSILVQHTNVIWRVMLDPQGGPQLSRDGTLLVIGRSKNETIVVQREGEKITGRIDSMRFQFDVSQVKRVGVTSGGGNDTITVSLPAAVDGGAGDDVIQGSAGNDSIYGGDGADYIIGGAGDDLLDGGGGADSIVGDDGNDSLYGGYGKDTLKGNGGDDLLFGDSLTKGAGGFKDILDGGPGTDTARLEEPDAIRSIEVPYDE